MSTTPKDDGGAACSRCGEAAARRQGHQWLCAMHYRFGQMRSSAKRNGKSVPSHEELAKLVNPGVECADCKVAMNWLGVDSQVTVVTLQHYRDGTYGLVCRSCNTRHAFMPGDSFRDAAPGTKYCPACRSSKPVSEFFKDNGRSGPRKLKSWCNACSGKSCVEWQRSNREHYNAQQRAGRANRKARAMLTEADK